MSPEQISPTMYRAIQLEKWHAEISLMPPEETADELNRCEMHMGEIAGQLNEQEHAGLYLLRLRSEIRRIMALGLYATAERNRYAWRHREFYTRVDRSDAIDKEQLVDFGIMVEPGSFTLWGEDYKVPVHLPPEAMDLVMPAMTELRLVEQDAPELEPAQVFAEAA
jgi:hypothetical protein